MARYGSLWHRVAGFGTRAGAPTTASHMSFSSTGIKAALLKVAEPFFKSSKKIKHAEIVPIKIDGTFGHPSYGLDILK